MSWFAVGGAVTTYALSEMDDGPSAQQQQHGPPKEFQRSLMNQVRRAEQARNLMDFVPFDPAQEQSLALAEQLSGQLADGSQRLDPMQTFGGARDMFNRTMSGQFLDPDHNPALRGMIDDVTGQMTRTFERDVMPQIGSQATRAGAFGGSRQGLVEARAGGELSREVGDVVAQLLQGERQRQHAAMGMAPQFSAAEANMQQMPIQMMSDVGSARRNMAQQEQMFPFMKEQALQDILLPAANAAGGTATTMPSMPGSGVQALQALTGGAQLGGTFGDAWQNQNQNQTTNQTIRQAGINPWQPSGNNNTVTNPNAGMGGQ